MPKVMNVKEFAKISGYSPASISRAFSNKSRIASTTANDIMKLARKYHFRPNRASAASFGNRTQSVGILMYTLKTSYFADIFSGIQNVMCKNSYLPIYLETNGENDYHNLSQLIDHRVDGVIMIDISRSLDVAEKMEIDRMKLPLVMIDSQHKMANIDRVDTDDDAGGRMMAEYLLGLGHHHFVAVGPQCKRCLSFQTEVEKNGGTVEICFMTEEHGWEKQMGKDLTTILNQPNRPTAIFGSKDNIALEVYKIARDLNLRIPDDVNVVGYADLVVATVMYPELTTVRQDGFVVGQTAARILLQRIINSTIPVKHEVLPVTLQIRNSCSRIST